MVLMESSPWDDFTWKDQSLHWGTAGGDPEEPILHVASPIKGRTEKV